MDAKVSVSTHRSPGGTIKEHNRGTEPHADECAGAVGDSISCSRLWKQIHGRIFLVF
jgi:hypothetical protein